MQISELVNKFLKQKCQFNDKKRLNGHIFDTIRPLATRGRGKKLDYIKIVRAREDDLGLNLSPEVHLRISGRVCRSSSTP